MTAALALVTVVTWGLWIPVAQIVPGASQRVRAFYATAGNAVLATVALVASRGQLSFGWRAFWLPLAGGLVWTAGNYSAFRATELVGLARAAGTWTSLNVIVAFAWGAALFGELSSFSAGRFAVLGAALVLVLTGVALIVRSQGGAQPAGPAPQHPGSSRRGLGWAVAAGVLWGSYFIPAQWAHTSAQAGNFPLALGIFLAGLAMGLARGGSVRLAPRAAAVQFAAGVLFGIGNITLLALVARVGTGVGFTIAQLSLLVNASVGIWVFKVPPPGSRAARIAIAGIVIAGLGGAVIGAMR